MRVSSIQGEEEEVEDVADDAEGEAAGRECSRGWLYQIIVDNNALGSIYHLEPNIG